MGHGCAHTYDNSHRGFVAHAQKSAVVLFVVFAIWAMSGFGMVWPVVVMGVVALKLGAHARRTYGSGGADGSDGSDGSDGRTDRADDAEPEFTIL